jgi:catechol 2,3-dioxygenase-like lactoylglutathione lyase family enzyme
MLFAHELRRKLNCAHLKTIDPVCAGDMEKLMPGTSSIPPRVNGVLETSLYVESPARSAEFYRRVFGFEPLEPNQPLNDETRLCPMRAGDRSVLLLFKKGATPDTGAAGAIHVAFGIARSDLTTWEHWLEEEQGISIELRKTWEYGAVALYFRDPDGHLLEVVTPGVWSIY